MKKLQRSQLRSLRGGVLDGGGAKCKANTTCGKWVGGASGHYESGTCSMGQPNGPLPAICECSNNGTGCETVPGDS